MNQTTTIPQPPQSQELQDSEKTISLKVFESFIDQTIIGLINRNTQNNNFFYTREISGNVVACHQSSSHILRRIKPYVLWVANLHITKLYAGDMGLMTFSKTINAGNVIKLKATLNDRFYSASTLRFLLLFISDTFTNNFQSNEVNKIIITDLDHILTNN